jgi:hypothetical protein
MAASPMPPSTRRIVRRESQEAPIHAPSTAPTATAPASGAKAVQSTDRRWIRAASRKLAEGSRFLNVSDDGDGVRRQPLPRSVACRGLMTPTDPRFNVGAPSTL